MIDFDIITPDILLERADALPDELLPVAQDPATKDIVAEICRSHNLTDEESINIVEQLVGLVVLGLVHDYDLAREINEALGASSSQLGNDIAQAIAAKIFAPVKDALTKNYRPVTASSKSGAAELPRIIEEIQPTVPAARATGSGPVYMKMSTPSATAAATPSAPIVKPMAARAAPAAPMAPIAPAAGGESAPFMLHTVSEFQPLKPAPGFNLNMGKGTASASTSAFATATGRSTTVPTARVEIGSLSEAIRHPGVSRTEISAPRVVHYSELKTQTPAFGSALPQAAPTTGFGSAGGASSPATALPKPAIPTAPIAPVRPVAPVEPVVTPAAPKMPTLRPEVSTPVSAPQPIIPLAPVAPNPVASSPSPAIIPATTAPPQATPATPPVVIAAPKIVNYGDQTPVAQPTEKSADMLQLPS